MGIFLVYLLANAAKIQEVQGDENSDVGHQNHPMVTVAEFKNLFSGPWLVRVRRVQLHPSILGNGCMHPSIFTTARDQKNEIGQKFDY